MGRHSDQVAATKSMENAGVSHRRQLSAEMVDGRPRFYGAAGALLEKGRWRPPDVVAA